jgi:REP element-mobilizing transposase RayT
MQNAFGVLITWTTYGTWLPGDDRGWRMKHGGNQPTDPKLEAEALEKMKFDPVCLSPQDRATVEIAGREHCDHRGWKLHAVNARSNHVHIVVVAEVKPQTIRDQLKANCTARLRRQTVPLTCERTWTKGGDCEVLFDEQSLQNAIEYVLNAQ